MQVIHILTAFSIPDHLASGPLTAAEIATAAGNLSQDLTSGQCNLSPWRPQSPTPTTTSVRPFCACNLILLMRTCRREIGGLSVAGTATGSDAGFPGGRHGPSRRHSLPQQSPVRHSSQRSPQQRQVKRHELRTPLPTTRRRDANFPYGLAGRDLRAILALHVQPSVSG